MLNNATEQAIRKIFIKGKRFLIYFGCFLLCCLGTIIFLNWNPAAIVWSGLIIKASWEGGLALLIIWSVIMLWPSIHPTIQCWLWRLAYLKMIFTLLLTIPVRLPLFQSLLLNNVALPKAALIQNTQSVQAITTKLPVVTFSDVVVNITNPGIRQGIYLLLLTTWVFEISLLGVILVKAWQKRRQLISKAMFVSDPVINQFCRDLCRQIRVTRIPQIMMTYSGISSPLLIGAINPKIILPFKVLVKNGADELRLILAHELAHLKRKDLFWNWLPELSRVLFFFHPLIWLVRPKLQQIQETCCDYLAIQYSQAGTQEYGSLLLKTATNLTVDMCDWQNQTAFYGPKPKTLLKKRLTALRSCSTLPRKTALISGIIIFCISLICIVPWSVTGKDFTTATSLLTPVDAKRADQIRKQRVQNVWQNAIKNYQAQLNRNEVDFQANEMLGRIYYLLGEYRKAITYLQKVPLYRSPRAILWLGWCYDELGERQKALNYYQQICWWDMIGMVQESVATAARSGRETPHHPVKTIKANRENISAKRLPANGWKVTSNYKQMLAQFAIDGDPLTQWVTYKPQNPGMYFQIDLGGIIPINGVILDDDGAGTTIYVNNYPRKYKIITSTDGKTWHTVIKEMGNPNYYAGGFFKSTPARYIKIVQLGYRSLEWWSISELEVYTPKL